MLFRSVGVVPALGLFHWHGTPEQSISKPGFGAMFAACADGATPNASADVRATATRKSDVLAGISLVRMRCLPRLTEELYDSP